MSFLSSGVLGVYFTSLVSFSLVSHPVSYCALLILNALSISLYLFLFLGFSWYLVLFCLVYVGGVYVLFIFASIHGPNHAPYNNLDFKWSFVLFFVFSFVILPASSAKAVWVDNSWYLCSNSEGVTYCFLGLIVLLGFMVISVVVSRKDSFFR